MTDYTTLKKMRVQRVTPEGRVIQGIEAAASAMIDKLLERESDQFGPWPTYNERIEAAKEDFNFGDKLETKRRYIYNVIVEEYDRKHSAWVKNIVGQVDVDMQEDAEEEAEKVRKKYTDKVDVYVEFVRSRW